MWYYVESHGDSPAVHLVVADNPFQGEVLLETKNLEIALRLVEVHNQSVVL